MIKGILRTNDDEKIVFIGLSQGNVDKLTKGQPIVFDLKEIGLPPQLVCLHFGETEQAIVDEMAQGVPTMVFEPTENN